MYVSSPKVITSWNHLWLALMPAFYVFSLKQLQGQSPDSQDVFTLVNFSECIRFFRNLVLDNPESGAVPQFVGLQFWRGESDTFHKSREK